MYGYSGFNGWDRNTCSLFKQITFEKNKLYYTSDSSYPLAEIQQTGSPYSNVCSYIVLIENLGTQFDYVTFGKQLCLSLIMRIFSDYECSTTSICCFGDSIHSCLVIVLKVCSPYVFLISLINIKRILKMSKRMNPNYQ